MFVQLILVMTRMEELSLSPIVPSPGRDLVTILLPAHFDVTSCLAKRGRSHIQSRETAGKKEAVIHQQCE